MVSIDDLKKEAFYYRDLLRAGAVDYDTAKAKIMPWIDAFNKVSKEKAKKYGIKARILQFSSFVR